MKILKNLAPQLKPIVNLIFRYRKFLKKFVPKNVTKLILAKWRVFFVEESSQEILVNNFDGDLNFYCDISEHIGSQIYWQGFYSVKELLILEKILKPKMFFVDIGANQGEFTVFAAKRLTEGKVISFEPVSTVFEKLEKNVDANNFKDRVDLIRKGLSDKNTTAEIYTEPGKSEDGTVNQGLYTIHRTDTRSMIQETIELIRFDDFVDSYSLSCLDVMKIDIEGSELAVLRGAKQALEKFKPIILIEVNKLTSEAAGYQATEILDYLTSLGYYFKVILSDGKTQPITSEELSEFQNILCMLK